jgi:tRNA nucleotidyltransferase (CCA-adding enzyme)
MLLILAHENADFDAVAAQLAGQKLYPGGVPLLSRRVNRNVQQFLTLYWDALPFMRAADWQRRRVDRVLLVDTQSLPGVRGVHPERVEVQVIDHHDLVDGSQKNWTYHVEPVGAATTLLVEMLEEAGLSLTPVELSLLLLGIHEDTGSLVYDTTTARDARAAAWLLEQGAQLSIVRRFLDFPLSEAQQLLYDQLQTAVDRIKVEGQTVILARAAAGDEFEEEISAVAHRLRDALAPDGLILLVQLKQNHVQLVARSTNDEVDVSLLAHAFGGGGHSRAAAATILDLKLDEVEARVRALLPQIVRPMAKVAQIMSYGVQTLPANAPVRQAAELMQRFGYEGYPVIDPATNRVVGLLTRRAVDRAMSHKLERLPVSQVMKAGRVVVRPSDSVEQAQRLMIEEAWGQIPVVADDHAGAADSSAADSGAEDSGAEDSGAEDSGDRLIGVVTRTDLLNLLSEPGRAPQPLDMRRLLAEYLPPAAWQMVRSASQVAGELNMPLYFVGGLVRDLLLNKPSTDMDMVIEGDAFKLVSRLKALYGGDLRSHARFGTAKWLLTPAVWQAIAPDTPLDQTPEAIDFVTARTEFYTRPSALPEVERSSIKLDLHRRDFTINTLAVRLDGAHLGDLLDFYGGRRDLEQGQIRVLHSLSFIDDPTRILRAVRLEQRLGFTIEARTVELMRAALPMLDRVTGERIRHEIELALREADPVAVLRRLAELDVLSHIHPALTWDETIAAALRRAQVLLNDPAWRETLQGESPAFVYFALWILPLSSDRQSEVMDRLRVRKTTRDDVAAINQVLAGLALLPVAARTSQIVQALRGHPGRVLLVARAAVGEGAPARAGAPTDAGGAAQQIERYHREWQHIRTALNGNDLLALGLKPGPQIGLLLDRLLAARLDGEVDDEAAERALVQAILQE